MDRNIEEECIVGHGENENEQWDIYTATREKTGKTHRRGDQLGKEEYHLVVHVCIFNSQNQLLIQKRQPWKKGWPGLWDISVGGSAITGENSQQAAERETLEELGLEIHLDGIRPHLTIHFEKGFDDYYFIQKDVDLTLLNLQQEEVEKVAWVTNEELLQLEREQKIVPYYFLDKLFEIRQYYGSIRS